MRTPDVMKVPEVDLAITGSDRRVMVREGMVMGAAAAGVCMVIVSVVGFPPVGSFVLAFGCGFAAWLIPFRRTRVRAARMRGELDLAVSVMLDLMSIQSAGGAGVETALLSAAALGDGWSFRLIREALAGAQASRRSYWDALVEVGEMTGCHSLVEIANSARMAGEHGAKVRQTLASKSTSLRARNLARIEYEAQQRTEQMGLPMVVLFVSFLIFVGYPALAQTMSAI